MSRSREKRLSSKDAVRKHSTDSKTKRQEKIKERRDSQNEKSNTHKPISYVISKKTPTILNPKIDPVICENTKTAFVACGNTILAYSLQTGLQIKTLRSKRSSDSDKKETGDMHNSNIVLLSLKP